MRGNDRDRTTKGASECIDVSVSIVTRNGHGVAQSGRNVASGDRTKELDRRQRED